MFAVIGSMLGYVGFLMVMSIIATTMLLSTVYCYIKLYIQQGTDGFSINDVWIEVTKNFWSVFGAMIVTCIVIFVGFMLCFFPGIYLGVALSIVFCIMIFEEKGYSVAFSRSMKLINTNWWGTFGVFIVVTIIIYIIAILFSIPGVILGFKSMFMNMKPGQMPMMDLPVSYYVLSAFTSLLTQALTVIPIVMTAFIYYSTVEKVEKPSLMDKIGQIRNDD
jgi:hypothetical protein